MKKEIKLNKKALNKKRKELLKRIVALDCTTGDYTVEVEELYTEKRRIEMMIRNS